MGKMIRIWVRPGMRGPLPPLSPGHKSDSDSDTGSDCGSESGSDSHESCSSPKARSSPEACSSPEAQSSSDVEAPDTPSPEPRFLVTEPPAAPTTGQMGGNSIPPIGQKGGKTILLDTTAQDIESQCRKRKRASGAPSPSPHARKYETGSSTPEETSHAVQMPAKKSRVVKIDLKGRSWRYSSRIAKKVRMTPKKTKSPCAVNGNAKVAQSPLIFDSIVVKPKDASSHQRKPLVSSRVPKKGASK